MKTTNMNARDAEFIHEVEERSGQQVVRCYQCGNCTAGCPYNFAYDIPVNRIMRLVQTGQKEVVLDSKSLWLCGSCQSCTTRCPNNIDVARIMDVLRHMARETGHASERNIKLFADTFLESVEKHGRVYEAGLMASYVAQTGKFLNDLDLAPAVLTKGKLSLKPHPVHKREAVEEIFLRFREKSKQ
ncbi:4Fe-4S dicluster domain-containing protein [Pseudodesulfovibrio tunisiensis]|uniref:4Fe-4S dicluster domain-containing protein n=1 Tax=Pseudodesulfovibrio tunisiensis TaxID=463192 RepID=UPI001FB1DF19|nr:4Fe-4S dicluster domain-containing protein [Pseudodesulfovibrio tunisiensis]